MSKIELIKELRYLTQAGMKDCSEALDEANMDINKAVDIIKAKGLNQAVSARTADEGVVAVTSAGDSIAMVEINCNTDFVANSKLFKDFVNLTLGELSVNPNAFTDRSYDVDCARKTLMLQTKEDIIVRRWYASPVLENCKTYSYIHQNKKLGVILTLNSSLFNDEVNKLGEDLTLQIAAMNPLAISSDKLSNECIEKQRGVIEYQVKELNKPRSVLDKIIDGKMRKWHEEVCLVDQKSIFDSKKSVGSIIRSIADKSGASIEVVEFTRFQIGETRV